MRDMPGQLIDGGRQGCCHVGEEGVCCRTPSAIRNIENSRALTLPTDINFPRRVIGVVLVDENWNTNKDYLCCLGAMLLDSLDISADVLRRLICKQIVTLPTSFVILTKQGWPLSKSQECNTPSIYVIGENQSVMIQKRSERPKLGVMSTTGDTLGFIFFEFSWSVSQIRDCINEQLTDLEKEDYHFTESNGWPVSAQQETILSVLDIIRPNYRIYIQYCAKRDKLSTNIESSKSSRELPVSSPLWNPSYKNLVNAKKYNRVNRTKWPSIIKKDNNLVAKPILISYVRAEAAQHAVDLKYHLEKQGHSVYLDVHEIKTGTDWQDALNFAVSNCQFFVPLITPMYGKTQWTNREVKLADVLEKNIIPISFLEQWPPECLAIQFASTQYIHWKPPEFGHEKLDQKEQEQKISDIRLWEPFYIKRVCKELEERCKVMMKKRGMHSEKPRDKPDLAENTTLPSDKSVNPRLVVISSHPKQKVLVHQLKITLEGEGYDVWCSSELQNCQESFVKEDEFACSSDPNTPRELNPIPEGYSVFGQTYNEIATIIADSKRGSSQKNCLDDRPERKQLSRMISQVSDISDLSSLTPDKMERLRMFQQKADLAGVVVIIVSEAYTKSKSSQQQVFYCEHRKQVVLVKFDQHPLPTWFTMLMGNDMITNVSGPQFIATLKAQVKRALNPSSSETPKLATAEAKIQCLVNYMKRNIPQPETCVYVAGSSKLQSDRSAEIARAIGKELAKVRNITLCTGGFFGAPDVVARTFHEAVQNNHDASSDSNREPVVHLLPFKDSKDFSSKTYQNPDGSFEAVSYGKTYFSGDSVKERETAVARLFDTCIVIEGGPGAAHEVEEFIWNDHFVIPIISTGGAAGGQFGVPLKIFEAPPSVCEEDWCLLSEKEANAETVAQAVVNIIISLKHSLVTYTNTQDAENTKKTSWKSKSFKEQDSHRYRPILKKDEMVQTQTDISAHGHRLLKRQDASYTLPIPYRPANRWRRFLRIFSLTKNR